MANGHITSEQLAAYNEKTILSVFGAARDAFYADYPDIFYVDFSSLSISVTEKPAPDSSVSDNDAMVYLTKTLSLHESAIGCTDILIITRSSCIHRIIYDRVVYINHLFFDRTRLAPRALHDLIDPALPQLTDSSSGGGEESPDEGDTDDGTEDSGEYKKIQKVSGPNTPSSRLHTDRCPAYTDKIA